MDQQKRIRCMDALRAHQEQESKLALVLASRGAGAAQSPDVILYTAQLIRHRISAALLTAELTAN